MIMHFFPQKLSILLTFLSLNAFAAEHKPYSATGTLHPLQVTQISSQVQGRVVEIYVDVGDEVEKDQAIAKLDPLFFDIEYKRQQAVVELAKIALEESEREYTRMKNLWEGAPGGKPSIPKKQFEDALSGQQQKKFLLDQAQMDLAAARQRLDETLIRAPYKGVITQNFVNVGMAITTNPVCPLFEIMDLSKVRLEFSLPQELRSFLQVGDEVVIEKTLKSSIDTIFPSIEVANRCFKCRVTLDNSEKALKPGAFVSVIVHPGKEA